VHFQNEHSFEPYLRRVEAGELPIHRALALTDEEKLIRQFILQLKLGRLSKRYFQDEFGVDVQARFAGPLERHRAEGWLEWDADEIRTTREGLLRVDGLLPEYFLPEHRLERLV
jgi:oxygen-independent coproporphyrinogen-3 oxidase